MTVSGYETEANNSRATADIIPSSSTITGQLSSNSDYDYFAIDVASAGFINLDFDSPTDSSLSYFTVSILDDSGNILSSEKSGKDINLTAAVSESGTYYARVIDGVYYNSENYQITATTNINSVSGYETEANNSRATADIISSSSTVTGQLSSNSDYDYFAIDVTSAGFINLDFDSPTDSSLSYFTVSILDDSGNILSSEKSGKDINLTAAVSESGTYYARVIDGVYYNSENYQITATTNINSVSGYETEANNSRATADIISSSSTVTGQLSSNSDYDYFAIDVASAGFINLDFDSPTDSSLSYFTVSILDDSGNILSSEKSGKDINLTAAVSESGDILRKSNRTEYITIVKTIKLQLLLT